MYDGAVDLRSHEDLEPLPMISADLAREKWRLFFTETANDTLSVKSSSPSTVQQQYAKVQEMKHTCGSNNCVEKFPQDILPHNTRNIREWDTDIVHLLWKISRAQPDLAAFVSMLEIVVAGRLEDEKGSEAVT